MEAESHGKFGTFQLKDRVAQTSKHENFVLAVILALLVVIFAIVSKGLFLRPNNLTNIVIQSSTRSLGAVGQAFVILTAGIDLSVGGVATLAACVGAAVMTSTLGFLGPMPMGAGIVIMLLVGISVGAINGALVSRLRVPALIVTLATWLMAGGLASYVTSLASGKPAVIIGLPKGLAKLGQETLGGVPAPAIFFVAAIVIGYFVLTKTTFGKSVYATGGKESAAWLSGIKTKNIKFWVFVISGFCAALAGLLQISRVLAASDQLMGPLELDSIAAVVVGGVSLFGGRGSLIGVLIGVVIIGVIDNGMNLMGMNVWTQNLVKGGIIFAAVAIDSWRRGRIGG